VNKIFKKLGAIVGIGVGDIDLQLTKHSFKLGDEVHGRLTLRLKDPVDGKRLVVGVRATQERERTRRAHDGSRERVTETVDVHKFEMELDGKRRYQGEAYDVHLPLPADGAPRVDEIGGTLGELARAVSAVIQATRAPVNWSVYAFLEIPWKANVKKSVPIVVG